MLYLATFRITPTFQSAFLDWFSTRHGPQLCGAGFISSHSLEDVDDPCYTVDANEIPGIETLSDPDYVAVGQAANDPDITAVMAAITDQANTTYRAVAGTPGDGVLSPAVGQGAMTLVRIAADTGREQETTDALRDWATSELGELGPAAWLLGQRSGRHPRFTPDARPLLTVIRWPSVEAHSPHREAIRRLRLALGCTEIEARLLRSHHASYRR